MSCHNRSEDRWTQQRRPRKRGSGEPSSGRDGSHSRDPRAADYGQYGIADAHTNTWEAGLAPWGPSMTLDDVEQWLSDHPAATITEKVTA